jgi:hypothetical protein
MALGCHHGSRMAHDRGAPRGVDDIAVGAQDARDEPQVLESARAAGP